MGRLRGNSFMLSVGRAEAIIAYSTNCEINISCDITEITNALSGRGKAFLPGRYEWSISVSGLMPTGSTVSGRIHPSYLLSQLLSGTSMTAYFGTNASNLMLAGSVYVKDWSMGAPVDGNATYNVTFQGTGTLATNL